MRHLCRLRHLRRLRVREVREPGQSAGQPAVRSQLDTAQTARAAQTAKTAKTAHAAKTARGGGLREEKLLRQRVRVIPAETAEPAEAPHPGQAPQAPHAPHGPHASHASHAPRGAQGVQGTRAETAETAAERVHQTGLREENLLTQQRGLVHRAERRTRAGCTGTRGGCTPGGGRASSRDRGVHRRELMLEGYLLRGEPGVLPGDEHVQHRLRDHAAGLPVCAGHRLAELERFLLALDHLPLLALSLASALRTCGVIGG